MKPVLATLFGAATLAACTGAPPPEGAPQRTASTDAPAACFRTGDITNHRIANDHTVYIEVARRDVFRLEMVGHCLAGTGGGDPLVIHEPQGVPYACRPVDLTISVARGAGVGLASGGTTPCIVASMAKLTPEEVAALPPKDRP